MAEFEEAAAARGPRRRGVVQRRLQTAAEELKLADSYRHRVVNDDLDRADARDLATCWVPVRPGDTLSATGERAASEIRVLRQRSPGSCLTTLQSPGGAGRGGETRAMLDELQRREHRQQGRGPLQALAPSSRKLPSCSFNRGLRRSSKRSTKPGMHTVIRARSSKTQIFLDNSNNVVIASDRRSGPSATTRAPNPRRPVRSGLVD